MIRFYITLVLLCAGCAYSQKIVYNEIRFQYLQLPLKHPGKGIHNYNSHIVLRYLENTGDNKLTIAERKKKAEAEYEAAMQEYKKQDKIAEKEYTERLAAWDAKTVSEKMMSEKPRKKIVPLPYKRMPIDERYLKPVDTVALTEKFLRLEGFTRSNDNSMRIKVFLLGFECSEPRIFEKEHTKLSGNHQTERYLKYKYAIQYRHQMGFRIEHPDGSILMEEYPAEFAEYTELGTPEFENRENLEKIWAEKKEEFLALVQKEILEKNLKVIGERINEMYGFRSVDYATEVGIVDEKKDYFDLRTAYGSVTAAYNSFKTDLSKGEAGEKLREAIAAWENAYKESDVEDKKARIDKEVTEMILINLAEACMWLDDYTKAQAYLNKVYTLQPEKKNLQRAEKIKALLPKLRERWEANR